MGLASLAFFGIFVCIYYIRNIRSSSISIRSAAYGLGFGLLARLYAETDRIPEAIHEARICLRLSPQFKAAETLIEELSVLPDSVSVDSSIP
jgi:hypothetical protein